MLEELHTIVLNLDDHSDVRLCQRAIVVKLDHINPLLKQRAAPHLAAPETNSTQAPESCAISFWDATYQEVKVLIPCYDNGRESVAHYSNDRIRAPCGEEIANEVYVVSTIDQHLSYRQGNIFVDEQQHCR